MKASNPTFDLIFQRWKAAVSKKSKKRDDVDGNFDELFEELKVNGATLEDAQEILPQAVKAHQPNQVVIKYTWNAIRKDPKMTGITEAQWVNDWNQDIHNKATCSMFLFFPIPDGDDDGEKKIFGNGKVSYKEYLRMQQHADSFEMIDTDELTTSNNFVDEDEMMKCFEGTKK